MKIATGIPDGGNIVDGFFENWKSSFDQKQAAELVVNFQRLMWCRIRSAISQPRHQDFFVNRDSEKFR